MYLKTPLQRARVAIPLAIVIVSAPWWLPKSAAVAATASPKVAELPCELARAVAGGQTRTLQLPGDLPVHLRLRLSCSPR